MILSAGLLKPWTTIPFVEQNASLLVIGTMGGFHATRFQFPEAEVSYEGF